MRPAVKDAEALQALSLLFWSRMKFFTHNLRILYWLRTSQASTWDQRRRCRGHAAVVPSLQVEMRQGPKHKTGFAKTRATVLLGCRHPTFLLCHASTAGSRLCIVVMSCFAECPLYAGTPEENRVHLHGMCCRRAIHLGTCNGHIPD